MKKTFKIIVLLACLILISSIFVILSFNILTNNVKFDDNKLINVDHTASIYDSCGNLVMETNGTTAVTEFEEIPRHTINAFIAIEDKRFYSHKGVDYKGLARAVFNNIKSFSFKEGGSTITQQLIKNTHLSNEKTLKRKLSEIRLALEFEKKYSKDEILEKYLNTIYFGDNCYGITSASLHYFNKKPSELDINESAMLAGIVKAPSNYSPLINYSKCNQRKDLVLKEMLKQNYITNQDFEKYYTLPISTFSENTSKEYDYQYLLREEINELISSSPYDIDKMKIYTNLNNNFQEILKNNVKDFLSDKINISAVILDKNGKINAYYSSCGNVNRQLGSTIKPVAVYAPAIEYNIVNSYTIIEDEKTNFNGYSPSNYGDKYLGKISVKDSLAVSSNVCAVKLLNYVGLDKSFETLNSVEIPIMNSDKNLSLALGSTEKGAKLTQIAGAYTMFANYGKFSKPYCVDKVLTKNNNLIKDNKNCQRQVIGEDTCYIINDMLKNTVENGTAKKLNFSNIPLYAKTGTVGNENGNTDAYVISYNSEYIVAVWFGNKTDGLMPNSITGGGLPTQLAGEIWKEIYKGVVPPANFTQPNSVVETYLDKDSYESENLLIIADDFTPERLKMKAIFKQSALPKLKSTQYINPTIKNCKTLVNNNSIQIELCLTKQCNAKVYKEYKGKKDFLFDTKKSGYVYIDKNLKYNAEYSYHIVPYFEFENKVFYGEEIKLDKIKTPNGEFGENWWNNEYE